MQVQPLANTFSALIKKHTGWSAAIQPRRFYCYKWARRCTVRAGGYAAWL